jgi:hypothetical protein
MPKTKDMPKKNNCKTYHSYLDKDGNVVVEVFKYPKPKKLSKAGEWLKANPNGILEILDMKAILR